MSLIAFISAGISFVVVFLTTPWTIRFLRRIDLLDTDQNKEGKPLIPISGGLAVIIGLFAGLMIFIFSRTFFPAQDARLILDNGSLTLLFAAIASILIITFIGFTDDLLRKVKYKFRGLRQWQKPLFTLGAAIPLIVVNAGTTKMALPFIGEVNFGILYPLLIIPVGIVGASNMVNMLAGFNGLETGLALIYIGALGLHAFMSESYLAALISLIAFSSLLAFFYYNKFPSKILPGDSLTYLLGSLIATIAIVGNIEKAALIVSIPFFVEFFLKLRSKFKAHSYGRFERGKLISDYSKVYSVPHIFIRSGRYSEKQVVYFIMLIEAIFAGFIWLI